MSKKPNDVVITGVGIVSCHGAGRAIHEAMLNAPQAPQPVTDTESYAPYPYHPLPEIDWSEQIPRRGDQRQMETWQRLGVYTAGLALDDAGMKDDAELCGSMDMIVAAGGGERDIDVDSLIVKEAATRNDRGLLLNEKLTTELRPTLFLAQLSNLLAGNISIVHKVTGSSKTFMGEEGAGVSALAMAFERIRAGQSTHALIGGAYNAARPDMHIMFEGYQTLAQGDWQPLWSRNNPGGGIITGSASAFLVLESRQHAEARNARIYATVTAVEGDRGKRDDGGFERRMLEMAEHASVADDPGLLILSCACGEYAMRDRERQLIDEAWPQATLRGISGQIGHSLEAQFPVGVALAALALKSTAKPPRFDPHGESDMTTPTTNALVTVAGYVHSEGLATLAGE